MQVGIERHTKPHPLGGSMSRKLLAVAALGALVTGSAMPMADAVTRRTTTTKKPATTKAAPTTAAATTAAPATTAAAAAPKGKKGGDFIDVRNFISGDPTTIDPAFSRVVNESPGAMMIFDGLMDLDYGTGKLEPVVAESFSLNAAGDVVTFKLRKGMKFSNGEDVLPSSFKCAWDRVVNPANAAPLAYHFDSIVGKKAVDDKKATSMSGVKADDAGMTLTVELTVPYADFVAETQHTVFSPMTKAGCAAGSDYTNGIMVGNGPFKMAEPWRRGQYIKLARNENYTPAPTTNAALLDTLEFKIVRDELAALNLFESGTGDAAGIPAGRFNELTKKYGDRFAKNPQLTIQYLGLNWQDKTVGGFENAKLRQAISLAINRKQINDAIFDGSRAEATGFTPPGITGVKTDDYGIKATPDVAKAKQLLAEWGKPIPDISTRCVNTPINVQICSIIKSNLAAIGIDLTIEAQPGTGYFDRLRENPGQVFRAGWAADFIGYDNFMYPLFHTKSIGGDNLFRFGNAQVDNLINDARKTPDLAKRGAIYQQAERVILEQATVVPLWWNKWSTIGSARVDNFPQGPTAFVDYSQVSLK
jgi:peptide/nickel transport system substrate-binding protein/oligopeptide transport system substrate-binding protein